VSTDGLDPAEFDPYDYPRHWEADVVLSDGGTVHLRPIIPDDASKILALHGRLSERTRYFRYFAPYPHMSQKDLTRFSVVDHHGRVAFGAFLGDELIAVGRYERLGDSDSAEVAFVVEDGHQGRGLGSILLEHLAAAARERGLGRFVAEVLGENGQMVRVFRDAGYRVSRALEEGVLHLEFAIDQTEASVAVARSREQAAEARSVHNLLHPRSVAVIGASSEPNKVGYAVLTNLLSADFAGPVYPVNSEHRSVRGVRAYPSVLDIPDSVDLAVVAVPAAGIDSVMDACLAKGVTTLVVLSSGFADVGPDGLGAERRLVTEARAHGMRVVGPNALGVVNTDPAVRLNATLAPRLPGRGDSGRLRTPRPRAAREKRGSKPPQRGIRDRARRGMESPADELGEGSTRERMRRAERSRALDPRRAALARKGDRNDRGRASHATRSPNPAGRGRPEAKQ